METIILFLDSIRQFWNNHVGEQEDQMPFADADRRIAELKELYPGKFLKHEEIFRNIRRETASSSERGAASPGTW